VREDSFFFKSGDLRLERLFYVMFGIEILIFLIVSALPAVNPTLLIAFKQEQSTIDTQSYFPMFLSIFPSNLRVATLEFIPALGTYFYLDSIVVTSYILALEGTSIGISGIFLFLSLALLPHTWLEIPSYAVAASTSIYLLYYLIKRRSDLRQKAKKIFYMYLFVVLELAVAGAVESAEIVFEENYPPPANIEYPLLMWLPSIPAIIFLIILYKKINRADYGKLNDIIEQAELQA